MSRTKETLALDSARRMLHHRAWARVTNLLAPLHPAEVAEFLARVPLDDRRRLAGAFPQAQLSAVLEEMPPGIVADTIAGLELEALAPILKALPPAQAAGVLRLLPDETREALLGRLDEVESAAMGQLLAWQEGSVGSIMRPDPFALSESLTVNEAAGQLRRAGEAVPLYVYVVDGRRHLVGVVSFRQMFIADPARRLREIMTPDPISIRPEEPQEEAAALISRYDFVALPVVDEDNRLLAVVAVDDILDMLQDQATEDLYKMAGLAAGDRVFSSALRSVRLRLPWMTVNLGTAFLAYLVVRQFEGSIARFATLAALMPIVAGMGGNAATQTLTVVIRGLSLGELTVREGVRAAWKETATNLTVGLCLGLLTGLIVTAIYGQPVLGAVIGTAMVANMLVAGLAGASVPVVLRALKVDPAMASGVIVTTFTDCCGFAVFLGLATLLADRLG